MSGPAEALITAIGAGDLASVRKLLDEGASPDTRNEKGIPDWSLPKPGRVRFIFLTPGGSYGGEESFAFLNQRKGHYVKVFAASDQLLGLLVKHVPQSSAGKIH